MNQGGRGQQQQHQHPSSTSSISDTIDLGGGGAPQRPSSVSPTTPGAQHFRSLPNRGRNGVAAAADAANHNGNHVARQLNGACNNNSALAAGDSGCVEDIYAKVRAIARRPSSILRLPSRHVFPNGLVVEESHLRLRLARSSKIHITGSSKKNPAKFSDTCSVRAYGLCIGCLGQWAERGRLEVG